MAANGLATAGVESRLTQARGLKLADTHTFKCLVKSRLTQARGLKHTDPECRARGTRSRLTQARGLKPDQDHLPLCVSGRASRRRVD